LQSLSVSLSLSFIFISGTFLGHVANYLPECTFRRNLLAPFLKMVGAGSSETFFLTTYQITRYHNLEPAMKRIMIVTD
jgi:hypothetical protein